MSERDGTGAAAAALREEFDAAFARPAGSPGRDEVPLLAIRVAGKPAALRVLETAGLLAARRIVPVPARRPELLGVAGVRGAVVPVYGLARLLGHPDDGEPRWLVLAGVEDRVGLALAALERHVVVPARDLSPAAGSGEARAHVAEVVRLGGEVRPVLSVPSLLRAITGR